MIGRGGGDRTRDPQPTGPVSVPFHEPKAHCRLERQGSSVGERVFANARVTLT